MEKNQKMIGIAIIALVVSLVSAGIAFAAMSQNLTINGGGTFHPANWSVKFNTSSLVKTAVGDATGNTPSINATTIGTYAVTLTKPGDSVNYLFVVENSGDLDAEILLLTKPAPTCEGTGTNDLADAALVCSNLVYTLTYNTVSGTAVAEGDVLLKDSGSPTQATMVLNVAYPLAMATVPENDVTITIPTLTITYAQK